MWEKIAQVLNECTEVRFSVDKRSVRDHMGILVNKLRKIRAEEKASGIAPDEPSELENLFDNIIPFIDAKISFAFGRIFVFERKFLVCRVLKWKILRSISLVKH